MQTPRLQTSTNKIVIHALEHAVKHAVTRAVRTCCANMLCYMLCNMLWNCSGTCQEAPCVVHEGVKWTLGPCHMCICSQSCHEAQASACHGSVTAIARQCIPSQGVKQLGAHIFLVLIFGLAAVLLITLFQQGNASPKLQVHQSTCHVTCASL